MSPERPVAYMNSASEIKPEKFGQKIEKIIGRNVTDTEGIHAELMHDKTYSEAFHQYVAGMKADLEYNIQFHSTSKKAATTDQELYEKLASDKGLKPLHPILAVWKNAKVNPDWTGLRNLNLEEMRKELHSGIEDHAKEDFISRTHREIRKTANGWRLT